LQRAVAVGKRFGGVETVNRQPRLWAGAATGCIRRPETGGWLEIPTAHGEPARVFPTAYVRSSSDPLPRHFGSTLRVNPLRK